MLTISWKISLEIFIGDFIVFFLSSGSFLKMQKGDPDFILK